MQCNHCYDGNVPIQTPNGYWWHEFLDDEAEPCKDLEMNVSKRDALQQLVQSWEKFDSRLNRSRQGNAE